MTEVPSTPGQVSLTSAVLAESFAVYCAVLCLNFTERNKPAAHASESASSKLPLKVIEFNVYSWIFSFPYPTLHVLRFCNKEKLPHLASATFN